MTHLMAAAGERPLMLSETGMDTIREGEEHQAELLGWQARAAFEIGLSGFIVFAFTDEWHTGGVEIADWAFGLVKKDRSPKRAFDAVGEIFRGELPPPLTHAPKASVIVPAYNSAATIAACLESLKTLHYPDYETIVIDDGSTDSTAQIAEDTGARVIRTEHRGLAVARNAGTEAASGEIVAFIDSDARADADWLYHLVEAITRRGAAAAGGPNFAPPSSASSDADAAFAVAPGIPREVRGDGDELTQLCGCNMAITKAALREVGGFDTSFIAAGDDVDLSWRLADLPAEKRAPLVDAPGAVVSHARRATLRDYLRQQRGYGAGEGLLYKKYPLRTPERVGLYGGAGSWLSALLGGPRVYHGAFGRGLFQSVYAAGDVPWLAELPQTFEWVALSVILAMAGGLSPLLGTLGCLGIVGWIATAILSAAFADTDGRRISPPARAKLAMLCLIGPLMRSEARARIRFRLTPSGYYVPNMPFSFRGRIVISADEGRAADKIDPATLLPEMRAALVKYGLAVAATDGFKSWDLNIVLPGPARVPINALRSSDGSLALVWRTSLDPMRTIFAAAAFVIVAMLLGWLTIVAVAIFVAAIASGLRRLPSLVTTAARSIADSRGLKITVGARETL